MDQIEVCYSDVMSIDNRETLMNQYGAEPLNASISRGTAINLQEELDELTPFKGSIYFEPGQSIQESNNFEGEQN